MALGWYKTSEIGSRGWTCGYCGKAVGGNVGYHRDPSTDVSRVIYICPHCQNPTAFVASDGGVEQIPGPVCGHEVGGLPASVAALYGEVRRCVQYNAMTSAVLSMRKLLMHVAVEQGAEPNKSFVSYVDYLAENGWIPPNGREWVDALRKGGNEATHEIALADGDEAMRLLDFTEMLLKFVYEFPARMRK